MCTPVTHVTLCVGYTQIFKKITKEKRSGVCVPNTGIWVGFVPCFDRQDQVGAKEHKPESALEALSAPSGASAGWPVASRGRCRAEASLAPGTAGASRPSTYLQLHEWAQLRSEEPPSPSGQSTWAKPSIRTGQSILNSK